MSLDSYETYCHDHPNNTLVADMVADMEDAFAAEDMLKPNACTMAITIFSAKGGAPNSGRFLIPDKLAFMLDFSETH